MGGIAGFFADSLVLSNHDLAIAIAMGCLQFGVGFFCFTVASRYIMASEVALFSLTESIFAPLWVWIGVGEQPSLLTLIGSAVVLLSVGAYCVSGIRAERRLLRHPSPATAASRVRSASVRESANALRTRAAA